MRHDSWALLHRLVGLRLVCADGTRVGRVDDVFVDPVSARAEWLAIRARWPRRSVVLVPLAGIRLEGRQVRTPFSGHHVRTAPSYQPHHSLTLRDERALHRHWDRAATDR